MATDPAKANSVSVPAGTPAGFNTGAFLPKDMTVRLVRADSAAWEIFLSVFWSITLTVFGIYLGAWISVSNQTTAAGATAPVGGSGTMPQNMPVNLTQPVFDTLNKIACIGFGIVSLILLGAWVVLKIKQNSESLKVPLDVLKDCGSDTTG